MKRYIWVIITVAFIGLVGAYFYAGRNVSAPISGDKSDLIKVFNVSANQLVKSPLVVKGEARGYWYFEASFPVKVLDADGTVLGQTPAQAKGEWMTENFVPFEATLEFKIAKSNSGWLVLEKDNPSGLPEHDDELRIPIRF